MKKVIVSESQVKRLVEKMVNEQRPVNQPAAAPQPYTINLQNAFPSGQYEINPQFGKIINDGVMQIQEYVRKNNIKDFKLVITPGESKVPNQTNLETGKPYLPGELATLRAESLKTYLESVIGNTFNVKPIIEVSQPVMGTTPWDGVNKDDPKYTKEQFVKVSVVVSTVPIPTPKPTPNPGTSYNANANVKESIYYNKILIGYAQANSRQTTDIKVQGNLNVGTQDVTFKLTNPIQNIVNNQIVSKQPTDQNIVESYLIPFAWWNNRVGADANTITMGDLKTIQSGVNGIKKL